MIIGITGHRPPGLGCGYDIPNPVYDKVCQALSDKFTELKADKIISGMALGTDQWVAMTAVKMSIPFIAAVPCDGQDSQWPDESKAKFKLLLDGAAEVVIVLPGPYAPEKMHLRDRWIVDHSDMLVAVWNGYPKGGTFGTIRYAQKQQTKRPDYKIHIIDPTKL